MAFINKIGSVLKQKSCKLSMTSHSSIYQAIKCFSSSRLFVGGLSFATDESSLRDSFTPYGEVIEARIIVDRESGRSRGFGFISYVSAEEASTAIMALDGRDLHGRFIRVSYASGQRGTSRGEHGGNFMANDSYGSVHSPIHNSNSVNGNYETSSSYNFSDHGSPNITGGGPQDGSDGRIGNFNVNCYSDGNAGDYNSRYNGGNSFESETLYNTVHQKTGD